MASDAQLVRVQDVFTRVWRKAGSYDESKGSVRTWLYGIARNAILDAERRRARRPPLAAYQETGELDQVELKSPLSGQTAGIGSKGWFVDLAARFPTGLAATGFTTEQLTGPGA